MCMPKLTSTKTTKKIAKPETTKKVSEVKGEVSPKNKLNALTAKEWIQETISVWRQRGLGANHADTRFERMHPAPFSFTDIARLIRFFSKPGQIVLDPFLGSGSTLKAAALEGRKGIGVELSKKFAQISRDRLEAELESNSDVLSQEIIQGDARDVIKSLEAESVDFLVTSPPYWNILHKKDHKAKQERVSKNLDTRYSEDDPKDLGNIDEYEVFLDELCDIFRQCSVVLRTNAYAAIIVSDFRDGPRLRMFHADLASKLENQGWLLKGITILHQAHKRIFPYGYPTSYVPNIHHQYIVILQNTRRIDA